MKTKQRKLGRKLLSFVLALTMIISNFTGIVPGMSLTAQAATEKTVAGLGTSAISNPTSTESSATAWAGSYVYYGKYNDTPTKYRVLDRASSDFGVAGGSMLLDCDTTLYNATFDADENANQGATKANEWGYSDLRSGLQGDAFWNQSGVFTKQEKDAIASSTKAAAVTGDGSGNGKLNYAALSGDTVFVLDAKEASRASYGYASNGTRKKSGTSNYGWWLRSPYNSMGYVVGVVYGEEYYDKNPGSICNNYFVSGKGVGVSPAFNINLSSVIFASAISGESGSYKLTLKDDNISVDLTSGQKVAKSGNTLTIPYTVSGDNSGNVTQVSVLVTDKAYTESDAKVVKYGKLAGVDSSSLSGTGTFELPSELTGTLGTDYHIYLLAEDVNGEKETDYANLKEITEGDISSKSAQTVTDPTKATDLTYKKDQAQALLTKGAEVTTGNTATGSIQYKVGADGTWSTEIPKGTNAGTYSVYYKVLEDETYAEYAPADPIPVTIAKADPVTLLENAYSAKYGQYAKNITLPSGWSWADPEKKFESTGEVDLTANFAESDNYIAGTKLIPVLVVPAAAKISYATGEVTKELNSESFINEITNTGDVTPTYISSATSVATVDGTGLVTIQGIGETTITANVADDNDHYTYEIRKASYKLIVNPISTVINTAPTAADITYGQKLSDSTLTGGVAKAAGSEDTVAGRFAWKEPDTVPNASESGKYDVVFTPTNTDYAESTCKVTIKVNKKTVSVKDLEDAQKPVAKTGDDTVYTGEPIELVTAPTADLPLDYEAYYSTDDGETWSKDIPKKTEPGTYTIKVKYVSKGGNCNDITLDDITVTITPVDKKALTDAITAAKAYYDTIKGNTDYSEAADKLDKAIKAAEEVAAKNKLTKSEVSTAAEALNTAKAAAEAEVKDIADTKAAQAVSDKIAALPAKDEVTKEDKTAIEEARAAYNALTEDQKDKVTSETLKKLTDAEDKLAVLLAMSEVSAKTGSDMTYTGNPIQLINTPTTALPAGYTMKYAVTTENKAPTDESLYTTSIPTATNAGTYYVWYYIEGKDGVNDTPATCITVTIAEESLKVKAEKAKKNNIATISDNIMIVPDAKGKVWTLDASLIDASSNEIAVKVTFTAGAKIKLNGYDKKKTKSFKDMNKASRKTATISTKGILKAKKAGTGIIKYATADGKIVTIEYTVVKPAIAVADGKDASVNSVAAGSVKKLKATYTAAGNFDVKLTGVPLNSLYTFKGKKVLNENNIVIGEDGCLHITGELEARKTAKVIINAQGKKYTVLITGKFR